MTLKQKVSILAVITTRDEGGRHFTEKYSDKAISVLEEEGLITIKRPTHFATGLEYSSEYYSLEITPEGQELVEAFPEYWPKRND